MIQRALEHRQSLAEFLVDRSVPKLTENEWEKLKTMMGLLKPCKDATDILGGDKYVSASIVLPHIASLLYSNKHDDDDPTYVSRFKRTLCDDLESRRLTLTQNMFLKCATVLDPRHKRLKCLPSADREEVWAHLTSLTKLELEVSHSPESSVASKRSKFTFSYESSSEESDEEGPTAKAEAERMVGMYRSLASIDHSANPLLWWKAHEKSYPVLSKLDTWAVQALVCLVKDYLAVQAILFPRNAVLFFQKTPTHLYV